MWQRIPSAPDYEISRTGKVRRIGMSSCIQPQGRKICLSVSGERKTFVLADLQQEVGQKRAATMLAAPSFDPADLLRRIEALEAKLKPVPMQDQAKAKQEWLAANTVQCPRMRARIRSNICGTREECMGCKEMR